MSMLGLGGIPDRRVDQRNLAQSRAGVGPAPQNNTFIGRLVIIFGSGKNTGLFVYSPTPGFGNLIASIDATGATDQYGNALLANGFAVYVNPGIGNLQAIAIGNVGSLAGIEWNTSASAAGPWTPVATMDLTGGTDLTIAASTGNVALQSSGGGGNIELIPGTGKIQASGDVDVITVGKGLRVAEGTNSRLGTATLVGGTVTVANTTVTAATRVLYARSVAGGTLGHLSRTISVGVSFTINSTSNLDTSQIAWMLVDPG